VVDVLNLLDGDPNARDPHLLVTLGEGEKRRFILPPSHRIPLL